MHSLSTFCALAFETGRLTPLPDRRQLPDRRKTWRGGRRFEDAEPVAHVAAHSTPFITNTRFAMTSASTDANRGAPARPPGGRP
jgi:hypothetical protein